MATTYAELSECARIAALAPLRTPPFCDDDRDVGLEKAWRRWLSGICLRSELVEIRPGTDGRYQLVRAAGVERGGWNLWSNVGRPCLMLAPDGESRYGYVLCRRDDGLVALNGEPYERVAPSAASAAEESISAISRASSGVRRA